MKSSNRIINKVLVSLFALLLTTIGLGDLSQAFGEDPREARFPKMRFQRTDVEGFDSTGNGDFYTEFLKDKTVIVQLFYQDCTGGVCEEGMQKLKQVQLYKIEAFRTPSLFIIAYQIFTLFSGTTYIRSPGLISKAL